MTGPAEVGAATASALAGAWRPAPPPLGAPPAGAVVDRLLNTGAAGLAWWRLRLSDAVHTPAARAFRQAYRLHVLQSALHEQHIEAVFTGFRAAGVEPVLVKGWAAARRYPEAGLRPFGDIDLCVHPDQLAPATALTASRGWLVDLHGGFPDLAGRYFDEVLGRSRLVRLGGADVRIQSPEDHLRHLCLHLLRHGAWRPLWLCDVAAAAEAAGDGFDWDLCVRGRRRDARAVLCAVGLAGRLLGAQLPNPSVARQATRLPAWLVPAVLRQWGTPYTRYTDRPLASCLTGSPRELMRALRRRWPNPVEATANTGAPFNGLPRLPVQLADCVGRLARFLAVR